MTSDNIYFHPGLMITSTVCLAEFLEKAPALLKEMEAAYVEAGAEAEQKALYPKKYRLPADFPYVHQFIEINLHFRAYNARKIPSNYKLLMMPDATFIDLCRACKSIKELNNLNYKYHMGQCRAYHIMVARKVEKLILSSLNCLESDDIPGAAATARSALENVARFCVFANRVGELLTRMPTNKGRLAKEIINFDQEFEALHVEHLYASNSFTGGADDETKKTITSIKHINALHNLDKALKKQAGMKEHLKRNYALLCDLTHPNVSSNFVEVSKMEEGIPEVSGIGPYRVFSFSGGGQLSHGKVLYMYHILSALSFSAGTMHGSSELFVIPFEKISAKLGFGSTYKSFNGLMNT